MIAPGDLDLTMYQGATFTYQFTWNVDGSPVNLSGYTARMKVRKSVRSPDVVLSLTDGAGLTLGGAAGTIAVSVSATDTAATPSGLYAYDLELDSGGEVTRLLQGTFTVDGEVTR